MKTRLFDSQHIMLLAGWLFADLLLALSMVFLVDTPSNKISPTHQFAQPITVTSTPSVISKATINKAKKTATSTIQPNPTSQIGLDLKSEKVVVQVDTDTFLRGDPDQLKFFKSKMDIALSQYKTRRAGLVITLGHHDTISTGIKLATRANALLIEYFPEIFSDVIEKSYWWNLDEIHTSGTIEFEIYFYTK